MREWDTGCVPLSHSSIFDRESPAAQTDYNPGRVSEVVPGFTSNSFSQVIHLSDADGEIVMHLDIKSASQRVCELRYEVNVSMTVDLTPSQKGAAQDHRRDGLFRDHNAD